jgi:hypothetical protein
MIYRESKDCEEKVTEGYRESKDCGEKVTK